MPGPATNRSHRLQKLTRQGNARPQSIRFLLTITAATEPSRQLGLQPPAAQDQLQGEHLEARKSPMKPTVSERQGLQPPNQRRMLKSRVADNEQVTNKRTGGFSAALIRLSFGGNTYSVWHWGQASFGTLRLGEMLRPAIPAFLSLVFGCQTAIASLFLSVLGMKRRRITCTSD